MLKTACKLADYIVRHFGKEDEKIHGYDGHEEIEIGLAKGKKLHDKRDDLAKKDQKREMDRASKIRY